MFVWQDARVMRTIAFLLVHRVLGLVAGGPAPDVRDVEVVPDSALWQSALTADPIEVTGYVNNTSCRRANKPSAR